MAPPLTRRFLRRCFRNMVIGQVGLVCLFTFVTTVPFYAATLFGLCVGWGAFDLAERQEWRTLERAKRDQPAPLDAVTIPNMATPTECSKCQSSDVEVYPAETADEPTILHCHECGHDEQVRG